MTIEQMESKLCPFMSNQCLLDACFDEPLKVNCTSNCIAFANDNNIKSEFYANSFYCARLPYVK